MGFAVPPCRELAQGEGGWVSGRTHRYPSRQDNPKKPLRSCEQLLPLEGRNLQMSWGQQHLPGESTSPPHVQAGLSLGSPGAFSALRELLWLCSQTNIWGFKGGRARLVCPLARWGGGAGTGIVFYARRLCDPAKALGLRERLSSTTLTYFLTCRRENSLLLIYSILLGFQAFLAAVSDYHWLGKWPR